MRLSGIFFGSNSGLMEGEREGETAHHVCLLLWSWFGASTYFISQFSVASSCQAAVMKELSCIPPSPISRPLKLSLAASSGLWQRN